MKLLSKRPQARGSFTTGAYSNSEVFIYWCLCNQVPFYVNQFTINISRKQRRITGWRTLSLESFSSIIKIVTGLRLSIDSSLQTCYIHRNNSNRHQSLVRYQFIKWKLFHWWDYYLKNDESKPTYTAHLRLQLMLLLWVADNGVWLSTYKTQKIGWMDICKAENSLSLLRASDRKRALRMENTAKYISIIPAWYFLYHDLLELKIRKWLTISKYGIWYA